MVGADGPGKNLNFQVSRLAKTSFLFGLNDSKVVF